MISKRVKLPLAPQNEQIRIVAKVEELFSELDKGVESLKAARAKLNIYRQAVLKHAFEGKLTAQWREENKDKLETPEQYSLVSKRSGKRVTNSNSRSGRPPSRSGKARGEMGRNLPSRGSLRM